MAHIYINQLSEHVGEEVTLKGWLYNLRSSGKLLFPQLRDGTGIVQCVVFKKAVPEETWEALKNLGQESALIISGKVRADERAPGGYEVDVSSAEVVSTAHDYPITPKEHGTEFLMDHRHLWVRSTRQWAILRVRATIISTIRNWLDEHGYLLVDTPIISPAAGESTSELFPIDYFEDQAFLAQPYPITSRNVAHPTRRRATDRIPLPDDGEGVLHADGRRPPRSVAQCRSARDRRLWKDHRRQRTYLRHGAAGTARCKDRH